MSAPDRACPDYPNECMHPWAHARTYAEVKATQDTGERLPAEHHRPLLDLTAAEVDALVAAADLWTDHPMIENVPALRSALDKLTTSTSEAP